MSFVSESRASPSREFSAVAWSNSEPFGAEFANVRLDRDRLSAEGVAINSAPEPYRLDYTLETAADFVANVEVSARGDGWQRSLTLTQSASAGWTAATQSNPLRGFEQRGSANGSTI